MKEEFGPELDADRINLAETADFDLGGMRVSAAHREVCMNDKRRELEPRVAQVLVALASARPDVVSRDRLIEQCWNGRIVGDDAINRCIVALRHLAKEFSPQPFTIETVARVGYSLVERPNGKPPAGSRRDWSKLAPAVLILLLLLAGFLALAAPRIFRANAAPASIALLPFRNLSSGDPYFAEGIGEEILSQLSREPQFRVAGRASAREFGPDADAREVARQLKVDYVVEGSVRRQGDQVRVNADLVRASDGNRLWAESYDGKLDDIFAIQHRIGSAIAGALRRKLVRAPALSGPLVTNAHAYDLYLTARGLLKTSNPSVGGTAIALLRESLNSDPGYAPAWASLALATTLEGAMHDADAYISANYMARRYAEHALKLAPDMAEAHRELGYLFPYGSPESQAHIRRAAMLDPNNAENLLALGVVQGARGEFDQELATYRRANEIDPLWFRTTGQLAFANTEMGDRARAEAIVKRGFVNDVNNKHIALGRIAMFLGDYSEAARHWSIVARANSPRWSEAAKSNLEEAKYALGLSGGRVDEGSRPPDRRRRFRAWMNDPPTPAVWKARNRDPIAADQYRDPNHVAAKLMLNAGRARELMAAYDSSIGLLSLRHGQKLRVDELTEAPVVALTLRQAGRNAEAHRLLQEADRLVRAVYGRSKAPFWFDASAAAIWAVEGKRDEALSMLERAMARGWTHSGSTDLRELVDEPAFSSLHGQPRFERLRARLAAQLARERAEMIQLRI